MYNDRVVGTTHPDPYESSRLNTPHMLKYSENLVFVPAKPLLQAAGVKNLEVRVSKKGNVFYAFEDKEGKRGYIPTGKTVTPDTNIDNLVLNNDGVGCDTTKFAAANQPLKTIAL